MKNVPKNVMVAVALLLAVAVGGGVGWYWVSNKIAGTQEEQDAVNSKASALEQKIYSPEVANLERLEGNDKKVQELLNNFKSELDTRDKVFDAVRVSAADGQRGLDPDEWKKMFGSMRDRLTKEAADTKIKIPQDYDFSFSAYRLSLPSNSITLPLGIQLLGVDRLSEILLGAKVQSLEYIKRAGVEGREGKESADILHAQILSGYGGLYKVYPFELSFVCTSASFSQVINSIEASDLLFVIRAVTVKNEKQEIPQASQVKISATNAAGGSSDSAADDSKIAKLVVPVLGRELVQVNIRVDLLYLTLQVPVEKAKPQNGKSQPRSGS